MSDILRLALRASIPMVKVATEDPMNIGEVLQHLAGNRPVKKWDGRFTQSKGHVVWAFANGLKQATGTINADSYDTLMTNEITAVLVNIDSEEFSFVMDAGAVMPPREYIEAQLKAAQIKNASKYSRYFVGMTIHKVLETVMLTQARDGSLSVSGINETKAYLGHGLAGLEALDTNQKGYVAPAWADHWLNNEAKLLQHEKWRELWPKGFMLHGPPGTGKTELARYLALKLGYPLFKLDAGSIYSKWQGESEANLRRVLTFISAQGPCVFLIDEADKLWGSDSAGQASLSTMQSMMLWWLQSQSNEAITVMTANRLEVIPAELYRPGRLDAVHKMLGITSLDAARLFVKSIALSFASFGPPVNVVVDRVINGLDAPPPPISHATLVSMTRAAVAQILVEGTQNAEED